MPDRFKHKYVMLLDDNELDNFINEKVIEDNHFAEKIFVNTSGKSALEFINNLIVSKKENPVFPEAIFVDINMPMMDGFQFIENVRRIPEKKIQDCKFIILTSSIYPEDRNRAMQISRDITFLNKPLTGDLLEQIEF
jgi:CheY-like chemotaxis protein